MLHAHRMRTHALQDTVGRQFVRQSGAQTISSVMRNFPTDSLLQAKCCHALYLLATVRQRMLPRQASQRASPRAAAAGGRVLAAVALQKALSAGRSGTDDLLALAVDTSPRTRRDVREEILVEGCVAPLLTAMKKLGSQRSVVFNCLGTLESLAGLGLDAQDQLTNSSRRYVLQSHALPPAPRSPVDPSRGLRWRGRGCTSLQSCTFVKCTMYRES